MAYNATCTFLQHFRYIFLYITESTYFYLNLYAVFKISWLLIYENCSQINYCYYFADENANKYIFYKKNYNTANFLTNVATTIFSVLITCSQLHSVWYDNFCRFNCQIHRGRMTNFNLGHRQITIYMDFKWRFVRNISICNVFINMIEKKSK